MPNHRFYSEKGLAVQAGFELVIFPSQLPRVAGTIGVYHHTRLLLCVEVSDRASVPWIWQSLAFSLPGQLT